MLNNRAEQILWQFSDPILVLKNSFLVDYANAAFELMAGISSKSILDKNIHDINFGTDVGWGDFIKNLKLFVDGQSEQPKRNGNEKDGNFINDPLVPKNSLGHFQNSKTLNLGDSVYLYEFFNVDDSDKSKLLAVIRFREITKDVKTTDHMIQTEKMSGLGTLAAGFAHEINNPLYSIIGLSEMIIAENNKEKIDSFSQRIIDNCKKMVSVIEDLTFYSKSNIVKDSEAVNINERLDAALEESLLSDYSQTIVIDKNYGSMVFLKAKPDEIKQIFVNIFSNSFQAMKGKGNINISTSRVDEEKIMVKIQDTGEGIQKEFVSRVFDPFFTTKDQSQGTGLGLTSAYQLIKKYEGTVTLNSVHGEGTTIEICWPIN
jgi:two-component system NtrC family sensor kinase